MKITEPKISNSLIVSNGQDLKDIHKQSYAMGVWQRGIEALDSELKSLPSEEFEIRTIGTSEEVMKNLQKDIQLKSKAPLLWNDIQMLLSLFGDISGTNQFRLLLATVNHNMCTKFHTDNNVLRLLCTYLGPGTLWIPEASQSSFSPSYNLEEIAMAANPGEVLILKGAKYPGVGQNAVLHRSPGVEETGRKRILLRIDTN